MLKVPDLASVISIARLLKDLERQWQREFLSPELKRRVSIKPRDNSL
jgi:hypothetical protein